ncbi:MAG: hypothetical protein ACOYLR_06830 [Chlorobium sp.]
MKSNRVLITIFPLMVMVSIALATCGFGRTRASGKTRVGLSFSDFATERWKKEDVLMQQFPI